MRAIVSMVLVAGCGKNVLTFADENNYTFTNTISIEATDVLANADLAIDWSGLTTDVRGRTVEPSTIEQIYMTKFGFPLDELLPLVSTNDINAQKDADEIYIFDNCVTAETDPCGTSAPLSAFQIGGVAFDPAELLNEGSDTTWMVSAIDKPRGTTDLLMSRAVIPTSTASETGVSLVNGDTTLDWSVDLHSATPISAKAGEGGYALDWGGVSNDVFDNTYDSQLADELLLAHYDLTVAEIEDGFLTLDSLASEVYRASVVQTVALDELSVAATDAGDTFAGFTTDGTWLVGTLCTSCTTPVPLILSVVEVR